MVYFSADTAEILFFLSESQTQGEIHVYSHLNKTPSEKFHLGELFSANYDELHLFFHLNQIHSEIFHSGGVFFSRQGENSVFFSHEFQTQGEIHVVSHLN